MNKKARHIIIAINPTSQEAEHTVDWAISNILDSNRDQVDLVCALDLDVDFTDDVISDVPAMYDYQYLNDMEQQIESRSANAMKRFEGMLTENDINVKVKVYKAIGSEPRNILVEYTQASNADILIMGSRNLTTWKRFFWGSFSEYVQAHVNCPVIIVKE
ncbi:hypothetical protein K450DRAFT_248638 [Umbelopsis ramanniana AG]|uniref:UspA domain-containing protein n=1 Tax=Umbelopsis ramanniana AG TaxID=1314678 RepID=A0AAD5E8C1_UMBRA|nr:uncharacterized protein K450DRAFT_248638 [Umbelopsis ramanniana AG]KAI8578201.1 hypothetical protein K450DRAFT_248638 [Umbelopsis ramanniana AG]